MSNTFRRYEPDRDWFEEAQPLGVTAVMGDLRIDPREEDPEDRLGHGRSVQLTLGRNFTILTEAQALDLMAVLSKRLACANGFSATDTKDEYTVQPDGTLTAGEEGF